MTADILGSIDSALTGWEAESMRWSPSLVPRLSAPQMAIARRLTADTGVDGFAAVFMVADAAAHGAGSPFYAEVTAAGRDIHWNWLPPFQGDAGRLRLPPQASVTVTVDISDFAGKIAGVYRLIHDMDRSAHPRKHRRCPTCHPERAPRPLAANGREYHRRQKARLRRKHR